MPPLEPALISALAALATVAAAVIAGVVALTVTFVKAWADRRIAIDTAHRAHRLEIASEYLVPARRLLAQVYELHSVSWQKPPIRWRELASEIGEVTPWLRTRRRLPHDRVFSDVLAVYGLRRGTIEGWLQMTARPGSLPVENASFVMSVVGTYLTEITEVLEIAAEAYVFDIGKLRRLARQRLAKLDDRPLTERVTARRKSFEDTFGAVAAGMVDEFVEKLAKGLTGPEDRTPQNAEERDDESF